MIGEEVGNQKSQRKKKMNSDVIIAVMITVTNRLIIL
jgi:hypothetical protein